MSLHHSAAKVQQVLAKYAGGHMHVTSGDGAVSPSQSNGMALHDQVTFTVANRNPRADSSEKERSASNQGPHIARRVNRTKVSACNLHADKCRPAA